METATVRQHLLTAIRAACEEHEIPELDSCAADTFDRESCIRTLSPLWSDLAVPEIRADLVSVENSFIWLSYEVFRYGYLRLLEAAVNETEDEGAATWAAINIAAEPVPKESDVGPSKFA